MAEFTLDTSGSVGEMPGWMTPVPTSKRFLAWSDLTPFQQGYVEALFASLLAGRKEVRHRDFQGIVHKLYAAHGLSDTPRRLHPGTVKQRHEVQRLYVIAPDREHTRYVATPRQIAFSDLSREALALILKDCEAYSAPFSEQANASGGAQLWRDRQRGLLRKYPPLTLYLSDDGKLRFRETPHG